MRQGSKVKFGCSEGEEKSDQGGKGGGWMLPPLVIGKGRQNHAKIRGDTTQTR